MRSGYEPGSLTLGSADGVVGMEGRSGEDGAGEESILLDAGHRHRLRRTLPNDVGLAEVGTSAAGAVTSGIREVHGLG